MTASDDLRTARDPLHVDRGPKLDERPSLGEMLSAISEDVSTLMRQEVELAKAEVRESAAQAGRGAGLLGGSGVAAHLALVFVSVAVWWALGEEIGRGWSAVVVAVVWAIVALVLALLGREQLRQIRGAPRTSETLRKIPQAVAGEETS